MGNSYQLERWVCMRGRHFPAFVHGTNATDWLSQQSMAGPPSQLWHGCEWYHWQLHWANIFNDNNQLSFIPLIWSAERMKGLSSTSLWELILMACFDGCCLLQCIQWANPECVFVIALFFVARLWHNSWSYVSPTLSRSSRIAPNASCFPTIHCHYIHLSVKKESFRTFIILIILASNLL